MEFSSELQTNLLALPARQRVAITRIVAMELEGLPVGRLFKTAYSCGWCGQPQGRTGDDDAARRAKLEAHEAACEDRGRAWHFAASESTYYRWLKEPAFGEALALAREEAANQTISEAARLLQLGAAAAVRELLRVVLLGEKASDRRLAATAILDRASAFTAKKSKITIEDERKKADDRQVEDLLEELKNAG